VECGIWREEWGVWSAKCKVWSGKCRVWSVDRGLESVECDVKFKVPRAQCEKSVV
jgi:hypothetical protein